MKILLYGINFSPELTGIGKYSGEMADWLSSRGNSIKVITAPPYYPEWKIHQNYKNFFHKESKENIEVLRCPLYVPSKPNTIRRLVHLITFSLSSFLPVLFSVFWKPDIIIQPVPTLFCSIQTIILSKICKSKSIIHIQDFEVDAMFSISSTKVKFLKDFAFWAESKILKNFDYVSTISNGMIEKAKNKGVPENKIIFLPNWTNIDHFKDVQKDEGVLNKLGIDANKKIVLYSGNMGEKQGLEVVIHVAKQMETNENIQFVLIGEGAAKENLKILKNSINAENVKFLPLQPYKILPKILASCDCHLVIQKSAASDLVLPSKLVNILAVGGNSVITALRDTSLGKIFTENENLGVLVEPESINDLKTGILKAISMDKPNHHAQRYAKNNLDKEVILRNFLRAIEK
tara:strand:+ start:10124 stop:11335 length:1212 start_codon:yes stop_codon:yes gene_type:complete